MKIHKIRMVNVYVVFNEQGEMGVSTTTPDVNLELGQVIEYVEDFDVNSGYVLVDGKVVNLGLRPSPFHVIKNGQWSVTDEGLAQAKAFVLAIANSVTLRNESSFTMVSDPVLVASLIAEAEKTHTPLLDELGITANKFKKELAVYNKAKVKQINSHKDIVRKIDAAKTIEELLEIKLSLES